MASYSSKRRRASVEARGGGRDPRGPGGAARAPTTQHYNESDSFTRALVGSSAHMDEAQRSVLGAEEQAARLRKRSVNFRQQLSSTDLLDC